MERRPYTPSIKAVVAAFAIAAAAVPLPLNTGDDSSLFAVPDFTELPPAIEVVSERIEDGGSVKKAKT
jgi:hypothetical protein